MRGFNKKGDSKNIVFCYPLNAPRVGFEPTTLRLTAVCSAIELPRNKFGVPDRVCKYKPEPNRSQLKKIPFFKIFSFLKEGCEVFFRAFSLCLQCQSK